MISGNQKSSPEVDFRKSKIITGSRLPEVKKHHRKSTTESQKKLRKSTSVYKNIYIFFILFNFLKYVYKIIKHLNLKKITLKNKKIIIKLPNKKLKNKIKI